MNDIYLHIYEIFFLKFSIDIHIFKKCLEYIFFKKNYRPIRIQDLQREIKEIKSQFKN